MQHTTVLRGRHVLLEPLRPEHAKELADVVSPEDDVFRWLPTAPRGEAAMATWVHDRLQDTPTGKAMPFAQREPASGHLMGSTSLFSWNEAERCAEIGYTWLAAPFRRTGANREAKLLLLTHGFEALRLARIQLVTDARNQRSREAILGIGASFEGILRNHRRGFDGQLRDSAYYSIVDREWPAVKAALAAKVR